MKLGHWKLRPRVGYLRGARAKRPGPVIAVLPLGAGEGVSLCSGSKQQGPDWASCCEILSSSWYSLLSLSLSHSVHIGAETSQVRSMHMLQKQVDFPQKHLLPFLIIVRKSLVIK